MEHSTQLIDSYKEAIKKSTKIIVANRPAKLEYLINEELKQLYDKDIKVIDIKYSISKDIGSAMIIYQT